MTLPGSRLAIQATSVPHKNPIERDRYRRKHNPARASKARAKRQAALQASTVPKNRDWNINDLAWAAGVFEGEGCFCTPSTAPNRRSFTATVAMTDKDVVWRLGHIMQFGRLRVKTPSTDPKHKHHKMQYTWSAQSFQTVQATIAAFWPWLGDRRRAKAKEILLIAKNYFAGDPKRGRPRKCVLDLAWR